MAWTRQPSSTGIQSPKSVYEQVNGCLDTLGPIEVRTTKSQIAFRRKRGFAYLWLPELVDVGAEVSDE